MRQRSAYTRDLNLKTKCAKEISNKNIRQWSSDDFDIRSKTFQTYLTRAYISEVIKGVYKHTFEFGLVVLARWAKLVFYFSYTPNCLKIKFDATHSVYFRG